MIAIHKTEYISEYILIYFYDINFNYLYCI